MRLKSIELFGFKSFAKKSKFDFNFAVTGIVGPNGSGKSNVVEAFRFVLGEQSMKSLRGKSGKDLIFKGSKDLPKSNRAYVEIVFDNKSKVFKLTDRSSPINLDFDEIALKREVFADGTNNYYINNTQVRLKDIIELLSSVNIGSSGHHIVSQGQADRILSSSSKDRRSMIEDALGLKVYQYKLKDASKKLEKTNSNIKEVITLRREIAPHIKYLKKQVEKIEKGEELRTELSKLYFSYFKKEQNFLSNEEKETKNINENLEKELKEIEVKIKAFGFIKEDDFVSKENEKINALQKEINSLDTIKEDLSRKIGRIEGMIDFQNKSPLNDQSIVSIKINDIEDFLRDCGLFIEKGLKEESLNIVKENILNIKNILNNFGTKFLKKKEETINKISFKELEETKRQIISQIEEIENTKRGLVEKTLEIRGEIESFQSNKIKDQEIKFSLETRKNKILNEIDILKSRLNIYLIRKNSFDEEMKEAVVLVGRDILNFMNKEDYPSLDLAGEELKKQIERIKIKLEDIGTGGGEDVLREYKEVTERDTFLSNELSDLEKSIENLKSLIDDLKNTLEKEFKDGLAEINKKFEEFFGLMFGGGSAYLSTVIQDSKKNNIKDEDLDEEEILGDLSLEENKIEQGIEINITLPQKKVKDLAMLSGGERSLTSIALVFAMTQVNPPPFLVLDETDAALDEANSRRYGDMIEKLSKYSQLITVTHNRETMSRSETIYGVTIGSDGSSKILSIKFTEAEGYAK